MVVMTPALLSNVVAPLLGLGAQVAASTGNRQAAQTLSIGAGILGLTEGASKAFGGAAETGTKLSKTAGEVGSDFGKSMKIGKLKDFSTSKFFNVSGKEGGGFLEALKISPDSLSGGGFNSKSNLESLGIPLLEGNPYGISTADNPFNMTGKSLQIP